MADVCRNVAEPFIGVIDEAGANTHKGFVSSIDLVVCLFLLFPLSRNFLLYLPRQPESGLAEGLNSPGHSRLRTCRFYLP